MGRPPAYIFVVRHGYRLDAADKQWHLSSPAPYDPPLTYSGWLQTQALGAKISSLLRQRIQEDEAAGSRDPASGTSRKRRKYKIIVHSSPFLRCVQTSIGLSAGIAKDPTPLQTAVPNDRIPANSPDVDGLGSKGGENNTNGGSRCPGTKDAKPAQLHETRKIVLRLDAFLGEWLTPGYFELITPPPESVMMLATAKADLLRPEHYQTSFPVTPSHFHSNSQGQLWGGSPRASSINAFAGQSDTFDTLSNMTDALPRSSSMSSQHGRPSLSTPTEPGGYFAPVPHYAISSSAAIPLGYVAHARDACVKVDYQWDSMRAPLDWGDGGKFGEEWTEMHRRFRNGIQRLVDWYASTENPTDMVTRTARLPTEKAPEDPDCAVEDDPDDEDDTEAVVILVSHGAGCNALIGALTHQPVLMDVSMASLTMAVRKPTEELDQLEIQGSARSGHSSQGKPKPIPIHEYYDLKILASTEHLRSNSQSSGVARSPSTSGASTGFARGRFSSPFASPLNHASYGDLGGGSRASSANATLTDSRRPSGVSSPATEQQQQQRGLLGGRGGPRSGITVGSGVTSFSTRSPSSGLSRTPSIGLWSPVPKDDEEDEDEDDSMVLNFSHERTEKQQQQQQRPAEQAPAPAAPAVMTATSSRPSPPATNGEGAKENGKPSGTLPKSSSEAFLGRKADAVPEVGLGISSLWGGGPRPPGEAERIRDLSSTKRRWTVNRMET